MEQVIVTAIHRRKIAIALYLIIKELKRRPRNQCHRRLWSRHWLQRRDFHSSVLTMLFYELELV